MSSNPSSTDDKKNRRRSDYPFFLSYNTRWTDNDQYTHVNNALYYHFIDTAINTYLIQHCGLAPTWEPDSEGNQIGLVVSSFCEFFSPVSFPDVLDLGLRVTRIGRSSVTYEVGVFRSLRARETPGTPGSLDAPAAVGGYTHAYVDKDTRRSAVVNARARAGLEKLIAVTCPKSESKL